MGWTTLSNKTVKVKKPRVCHGCNTKYPVGTNMNRNVAVDGEISTTYLCLICEEFMTDKWSDLDEDGIGQGDIWEYTEYKEFRENKLKEQL